ncbi:MAG: hypothetical protein KF764_24405 [Labilithrix sp.]|nr:hypothetical protein [Labilithrix sp.]
MNPSASLASFVLVAALLVPTVARADAPPAPSPEPEAPTESTAATPALPAPTPAPSAPSAAPSAPAASEAPIVELSADDGRATIERRASTSSPTVPLLETGVLAMGHWEHACVAPCQMRLDPRFAYRVAGDGLVPSDSFALPRGQDRVRVDARMGSSVGRVVGVLATAGGLLAMAGGGLALAATPILESEDVGSKGFRTGVLAGGIGAVSIGAVSAAVGLFLWLSNGSSAHAEPSVARQAAR